MTVHAQDRGWEGRRVLVTGAGGFIGSHLVELLATAGADVRAFVRYNSRNDYGWLDSLEPPVRTEIEIFRGDLTNPEAATGSLKGRDVIFHLGALIPIPYSYQHPREFVSANVEGTLNVLQAARHTEVERIVHVSTSEVYGTAQYVPIDEAHPLHPQSPYAATKVGADQLALSFQRAFELPVVVARPFNTYGPRQSARAVVPTIAAQALTKDSIELGATEPTRDFLYVTDTARGLMRCGEVGGVEGDVINLGSGREITIGELAATIFRLIGREVAIVTDEIRLRPAYSEVDRLLADARKADERLDWRPSVDLEDGLGKTIAWLRTRLDAYKPSIYNV